MNKRKKRSNLKSGFKRKLARPNNGNSATQSASQMWEGLKAYSKSPVGRYVVMLPTALSVMCNFRDIGEMALAIATHWKGLLLVVGHPLAHVIGFNPFESRVITVLVFVSPFSVIGAINLYKGAQEKLEFPVAALSIGCFMFAVGQLLGGTHNGNWYLGLVILSVSVAGLYIILRLGLRKLHVGDRLQFAAFPMVVFLICMIFVAFLGPRTSFGWYLAAAAVFASPFLAPVRLVQIGAIIFAIGGISLVAEFFKTHVFS